MNLFQVQINDHLLTIFPWPKDIKADNIMLAIADDSVFSGFEQEELQDPSPRKELEDGRTIYLSRELRMPKDFAPPVL